jgi:hypothetical protein
MVGLFRRLKSRGHDPEEPGIAPAQALADALQKARQKSDPPLRVVAVANNVHPAPTQHQLLVSRVSRPSGLMAVLETMSQCSQLVPPGIVDSPTPLVVPVTGHNLVLSFFNRSAASVTITDLRGVFLWIAECDFPAQLKTSPPSAIPPLVLSEDLRSAAEESENGYKDLEVPHYEVHLDGPRPMIVEALLPGGQRPREHVPFPMSLDPGQNARVILAPVTSLPYCIGWRLLVNWLEDKSRLLAGWDLTVTGFTGSSLFTAGSEPQPSPVADLGHWDPHSYYEAGETTYEEYLTMTVQPSPAWLQAVRAEGERDPD